MPGPLDNFIDNLLKGLEEAADEFMKDVNKEARRNLRGVERAAREATRPLPKGRKRSQEPRKPPGKGKGGPYPQKTLYDVLEVSPKASPETLSAAFRSLSARYHPDNKKTGNENRYKDITAAWTVLKDPERRKIYDRGIGL